MDRHAIVLFDGECNFCDSSVQFIIRHDREGYFQFASLQSEIGQTYKEQLGIPPETDSIVLIEDGKAYTESEAALRIAGHLDGSWKFAEYLLAFPEPIRDLAYQTVAKNRYKWFGKKEACMLPSPEVRKRFIG